MLLTYVEFRSKNFPPYRSESQGINPGRFGKRLAEYLATELRIRGERVGELFAEDWGWVIPIENPQFAVWIGVGNSEDVPDGFLCFIHPHTEFVRRLWRKIPTRARIERLQARMDDALRSHPDVRDVRWSSHADFHSTSGRTLR